MEAGKTTRKPPAYSVPALQKGLQIIEILAAENDGLTQKELAALTGRTLSENFRIIVCLTESGYVVRGPDERYRLSMKLFRLAHQMPPSRRIVDAALPEMHALAQRVRQSCHVGIEDDNKLLILAQVESPAPVGINVRIGASHALASTASGRVILSFSSHDKRLASLREAGIEPDSGMGRLTLDRIERIARLGHETVADDTMFGVVDLSCPILDPWGACLGALTIPFLTSSGKANEIEEALDALKGATSRISAALGRTDEETTREGIAPPATA